MTRYLCMLFNKELYFYRKVKCVLIFFLIFHSHMTLHQTLIFTWAASKMEEILTLGKQTASEELIFQVYSVMRSQKWILNTKNWRNCWATRTLWLLIKMQNATTILEIHLVVYNAKHSARHSLKAQQTVVSCWKKALPWGILIESVSCRSQNPVF